MYSDGTYTKFRTVDLTNDRMVTALQIMLVYYTTMLMLDAQ